MGGAISHPYLLFLFISFHYLTTYFVTHQNAETNMLPHNQLCLLAAVIHHRNHDFKLTSFASSPFNCAGVGNASLPEAKPSIACGTHSTVGTIRISETTPHLDGEGLCLPPVTRQRRPCSGGFLHDLALAPRKVGMTEHDGFVLHTGAQNCPVRDCEAVEIGVFRD